MENVCKLVFPFFTLLSLVIFSLVFNLLVERLFPFFRGVNTESLL